MTVNEAISIARAMRPNELEDQVLHRMLTELDGVLALIAGTDGTGCVRTGAPAYGTELSVPAPFDRVYWAYLMSMIDLAQGNVESYAVSRALYTEARDEYARRVRRGEGSR